MLYSFVLFLRGVGAVSPGYSVRIIPILGSMSRPCSRPVPRLVRMGLADEAGVVAAGAKSHRVAATGPGWLATACPIYSTWTN
jgi:hypothetical protein